MNALEALLEKLFDYAGMFPPASRSLEDALAESAKLPTTLKRPQMLAADLVLDIERLDDLNSDMLQEAGFTAGRGCKICVVGVRLEDSPDAARKVTQFNQENRFSQIPQHIIALEISSDLAMGSQSAAQGLMPARYLVSETDVRLYLEPRWSEEDWNERFDEAFASFDATNTDAELRPVGLKVRCAGDTALGPATLARIIPEVNKRELHWKVTQGLHHPMADPDAGVPVGFLGLASALRLQHVLGDEITQDDLARCIGESDPAAFDFGPTVRWRDQEAQVGDAIASRFRIGSCNLIEPDEELARLFAGEAVATS